MSTINRDFGGSASHPLANPPAGSKSGAIPHAGRARAIAQALGRGLPAVAVIAILAGLAMWGYRTDWTLPKFSALVGREEAEPEDWCSEHSVPESLCIECNASLGSPIKDYGWCAEHGIAQCPLHHPEVAQLKVTPKITPADMQRAQRALVLAPRVENNSRCGLHQRRIQFASLEALDKAGVDIAVVHERPVVEAVVANGEILYDQTRMAHLSSRAPGTIWQVDRQVGERVTAGEILLLVDAAEVGRAKSEFQQALAQVRLKQTNVERMAPLAENGSIPDRQVREASAALQDARIKLLGAQQALVNLGLPVKAQDFADLDAQEIALRMQFLGLPEKIAAQLDAESTTSNLLPLKSPLDGIVVERNVVPGEVVDTATKLFTVADVSRMWLTLDVRQDDAKYLSLGQPVLFRPSDSKSEPEIKGTLAWISTEADDQTRTVKVRVNLPNADGRLRANTFGTGRIVLREEAKAIVVPSEAIHWDGACHVVFVRDKNFLQPDAPKIFHVRAVRPGVKENDTTEIIAGLLPGEVIASKNSVVLEAQLLKTNLGAGCGCCEPIKK